MGDMDEGFEDDITGFDQLPPYSRPTGKALLEKERRQGLGCLDVGARQASDGSAVGGSIDPVNHPPHYVGHPSGVECIDVVEHMNYCRGNAVKYIWRAGKKGGPDKEIEDLKKARFCIDREISRLEKGKSGLSSGP